MIIAILSRVKVASSFDIQDIVLLARTPNICTVMLSKKMLRAYRMAMRRAPPGLTGPAGNILDCITYLEATRAVTVAHNKGRAPVFIGELFENAKTKYSENVSEITDFALSAFETVTRLRTEMKGKYTNGH